MFLKRIILALSSVLVLWSAPLSAQYLLPIDFSGSDSLRISDDLERFANHIGVDIGNIPGFVFQQDREFPRIRIFYQQSGGYTFTEGRYDNNPTNGFTSLGVFTVMGDLTSNLQLLFRYNALPVDNRAVVLNGYGARFRSAVGTDSLHALAFGVMLQKLADADPFFAKTLDFSLQYGWFRPRLTYRIDLTASYISGKVDVSTNQAIGTAHDGKFEKRVIHTGFAVIREWNRLSGGLTLRYTPNIWNVNATIGWSLPSNF
ncbi:MAG: hypothetical protein MAGBODY4_00675 [Candidatus Marinimicrobia bacterium]|nr:hypothetical protein [Candidatus Neomarinimicrobiota bacterium]